MWLEVGRGFDVDPSVGDPCESGTLSAMQSHLHVSVGLLVGGGGDTLKSQGCAKGSSLVVSVS